MSSQKRNPLKRSESAPGPALPARTKREYVVHGREYSIGEIVEELEDAIPFTVVVSKGYVNKSVTNIGLEENKAYRVQCVSRSTRILASIDRRDGPPTYYSLPDSYYVNMARVDRNGKQIGPRESIYQLLSNSQLPFDARFITDAFTKIQGRALFTSHIPPLKLIKTFQEVHILVNNIPDIAKYDVIDDDILYVPQFLDKIRLKRVIGINTVNDTEFCRLGRNIDRISGGMEFDMQYGALEMDEFWPHQYGKNINYTNMEPMASGTLPDLFPKPTPKLPTPLYEQLSAKYMTQGDMYEPLSHEEEHGVYYLINDDKLGTMRKAVDYTNDIPRGQVKPKSRYGQSSPSTSTTFAQDGKASVSVPSKTSSELLDDHKLPHVEKAEDIKTLTIDQVCGYLSVLKIGQYAPVFKDHLIDGLVLSDLDKDILTKEFGLTSFDAIKLTHFIKNGHIPK